MSTSKRGPKDKQIPGYVVSSKIPAELMAKLELFSAQQGRSYSWVIRASLQKFLLTYENTKVLVGDVAKTYPEPKEKTPAQRAAELAEQDAERLDSE